MALGRAALQAKHRLYGEVVRKARFYRQAARPNAMVVFLFDVGVLLYIVAKADIPPCRLKGGKILAARHSRFERVSPQSLLFASLSHFLRIPSDTGVACVRLCKESRRLRRQWCRGN